MDKKEYIRDKRSPKPKNAAVSKVMSANKAKNTKPEMLFRKALWAEGIRGYRCNYKNAPGRPDIAFPKKKIAIFVNGCFWHGCPYCKMPLPKNNTEFWSGFLKDQEGIELMLDVTNISKVITSLQNNEVDFAFVSVLPEKLKVESIELMPNKLYVVGNTDQRFKNSFYDKGIFEKLPIIFREEGSGTRVVMEKFISKNNLPIHKKMELTSNEAVKQAVIAGLGYSIMPLIGIKNELLNKDLQIIKVKGFPIESTWRLIWLKNKKLSPVALAFLNYLKSEKDKISNERFEWFNKY